MHALMQYTSGWQRESLVMNDPPITESYDTNPDPKRVGCMYTFINVITLYPNPNSITERTSTTSQRRRSTHNEVPQIFYGV